MATSRLGAFSIPACTAKSPNPAFSAACLLSQQHGSQCGGKPVFCSSSFPHPSLPGSSLGFILCPIPLSRNSHGAFPPGLPDGAPGYLLTQGTGSTRTTPWWPQLRLPLPGQALPSNANSRGKAALDFMGIKPKGFSSARQGSNKLIW